jgi:hypothetical protein
VSLSLGVFDFGMMPSVGDGSVPLHHHDPAIRLAAAGCGGSLALITLAAARPARQRQQCLYGGTSQPASSTQVTGFARVPPVGSKSSARTHSLTALGAEGQICREQIVRVALYPVEPLGSLP